MLLTLLSQAYVALGLALFVGLLLGSIYEMI